MHGKPQPERSPGTVLFLPLLMANSLSPQGGGGRLLRIVRSVKVPQLPEALQLA